MIRMSAAGGVILTCLRAISRGVALFLSPQEEKSSLAPIVILTRIRVPREDMIRLVNGIDNLSAVRERNHSDVNSPGLLLPLPNFMRMTHCFFSCVKFRKAGSKFRGTAATLG